MKKIIKFIPFLFISLFLSSCLEEGLEELPTFDEANITNMRFEYRWTDESSAYGKLKLVQLNTSTVIDTVANTVSCNIAVPAADEDFPENIRSNVSTSNIVGYVDLSTAAILKPVGDAPTLGIIGDFSQSNILYEVTAADGSTKIWSVTIGEFVK